ncbi:MAG: hypothetical protein JKY56_23325, partial [Kofleriaceae bacterium]|nr:hypothetical protein [Kofleriaceae bacterium]
NYARRAQIIESVGSIENNALLAEFLTESARLPGGGFSDDTTVAVCSTEIVVSEHENLKILLVENHAVFADMVIQEFLGRHQVILVATIYEAKRALRETLFDVLLIDYDLDDGKGVEVVLEATRLVTRLTIIAISAHSAGNEALREAGAFAVCRKSQFHRITEVIDSTFTKPPTIELGTLPPVY